MKWFRLYDDVLDDPKAQRLPPALFKHWINLLCLANKTEPRGTLPAIPDIAFRLRISEDDAIRTLDALSAAGLIDQDGGDSAPYPHNWSGRQMLSDNVSERVRRYRSNVPPKNDETLQQRSSNALDTDTDTDTDTEAGETPAPPPARARAKQPKISAQQIPDDFTLTDDRLAYATEHGLSERDARLEFETLRNWAEAKGEKKLSWDATWRNWVLRREKERPRVVPAANGRASPFEKTRAAFAEVDAALDDWIAQQSRHPDAIDTTGRRHA